MKTLLLPALSCLIIGLTLIIQGYSPYYSAKDPSYLKTLEKQQVSVRGFFESLAFKPGTAPCIIAESTFPDGLIVASDLDYLFSQVNSKQKCKCIVSFLSSIIPTDSAELGGYAIELITAYREKKTANFGLYKCPKQDSAVANKLLKWRAESKQKRISAFNKY
ncbi:hypothetical protein U0035_04930 [Niabella yanshanensis]|uniref:Uncharacterized protein n=1 Tax=Niabella yanshanensis TaxID=577386 RepID=A0ABZ0WBT4_9BACT|nr:hypothetical protein [Niabella yanshanensis]WQD39490.1 hypothetical protein U0035_04930 [Niabella yanshanensis]